MKIKTRFQQVLHLHNLHLVLGPNPVQPLVVRTWTRTLLAVPVAIAKHVHGSPYWVHYSSCIYILYRLIESDTKLSFIQNNGCWSNSKKVQCFFSGLTNYYVPNIQFTYNQMTLGFRKTTELLGWLFGQWSLVLCDVSFLVVNSF